MAPYRQASNGFVLVRTACPASHHRTVTSTLPAPAAPATPPTRPRLRRVRYEPGTDAAPGHASPPAPVPLRGGRAPAVPRQRAAERTPVARTAGAPQQAARSREHAEAHRAIVPVLRLALEVLDRRRPADQLAAHFAAAPLRCWRVAVEQRRPRTPARLHRMRLCLPGPGAVEAAVTCSIDGRVRAIAARFERADERWRCTAIRLV